MTSRERTILLCDDDAAIRQLARAILSAEGCEFLEAVDAAGAIDAVDASPPGVVILDVGVPGGGLSVLEHIRAAPALAGVAVLLVTGAAEAREDGWGVSVGADGHLLKPFTLDGLRTAVRELIDG